MKKLLFILSFLIAFSSFGQTDFKNFDEVWIMNLIDWEKATIKMNIVDGVKIVDSSLAFYNTPDKINKLRIEVSEERKSGYWYSGQYEQDYKRAMKLNIAAKYLIDLNISPFSLKKNYFELFWQRSLESFGFVDIFYFKEKYGHNYRDILDYTYSFFKQVNSLYITRTNPNNYEHLKLEYTEKLRNINKYYSHVPIDSAYPFTDKSYENFKRTDLEKFIEFSARCVPLITYILLIYLILKIKFIREVIIEKYFFFGYKKNSLLTNRIKHWFRLLFRVSALVIFYYIIVNIRLIPSITNEGNENGNYYLKEGLKNNLGFNNINVVYGTYYSWNDILLFSIALIFAAYVLSTIIAFIFFTKKP